MDTKLTRRDVVKAGAFGISLGLGGSLGECMSAEKKTAKYNFDAVFDRYTDYDPLVPVWCVTPDIDRVIHRFHLSSSISPSGRYLGLTRLAREDSRPKPGEAAEIVLVDLKREAPRSSPRHGGGILRWAPMFNGGQATSSYSIMIWIPPRVLLTGS